jgi:glycosyltransferase involved in cell wall biosynthesis
VLVLASSLFSAPLSVAKGFIKALATVTRDIRTLKTSLQTSFVSRLGAYNSFVSPKFVSVIIPTFNRPDMLQVALKSLQAQTDLTWEAVVIDDGDGRGLELTQQLDDRRIRGFMNKGKGQVEARNTAILESKGDIIAWLDDDDWWEEKGHIERVKKALEVPALVHSHGYFVFSDKNNKRTPYELSATPESLRKDNTLLTSSITYPKFFHDELGLLDENVEGYFDWDWHLRVLEAGYPLYTIESKDVCYRLHSGGRSSEAASPQRLRGFEILKQKHNLDIQIKNHLIVFEEANTVHQ